METSLIKAEYTDSSLNSISQELDILRKAYELILENSNIFYDELGKAFINAGEKREFDLLI
jgi:hypothetical protein